MKSERVTKFKSEERATKKPDPGEWFQMAHKLTEALYSTKELDKTQIKLLLYIVHKTWGSMGRKSFIFVTNAAARALNTDKSPLLRARDALISANIILKADKDGHELMVNKYPETWDLSVLQKFRADETQRRKQGKEGVTYPHPVDGGGVSAPQGVTYPHPPGDVSAPPTGLRPAQLHAHGDPIDIIFIDKEIDNTTTMRASDFDAVFRVLGTVKGYPLDPEKDGEMLQKFQENYPNLDLLKEVRGWTVRKLDDPLKKGSYPRSQLNNWMAIAQKRLDERRQEKKSAKKSAQEIAAEMNAWADEF